jgi:hypothetical protein
MTILLSFAVCIAFAAVAIRQQRAVFAANRARRLARDSK